VNKILILQSNYIPWKGYFDMINMADVFVIYDDVQYTKNDWRNRNIIKTNEGIKWLTIPVRQITLDQRIFETKIAQNNWNRKHWTTIRNNYLKTSYFKEAEPFFSQLFQSCNSMLLSEINLHLIKGINSFLGIKTEIVDSRSLELKGDKNERLIEAVKKLNGDVYLTGPAAKSYLQRNLFYDNNINVEWMDYSNYSTYPQAYSDFIHGVTVLDLIFNTGKNAVDYMKSFSKVNNSR
jgi:hypothetical protein